MPELSYVHTHLIQLCNIELILSCEFCVADVVDNFDRQLGSQQMELMRLKKIKHGLRNEVEFLWA